MQTPLIGVYVGKPQKLADGRRSAMNKLPVTGAVALTEAGLAGDKVADGRFHGGPVICTGKKWGDVRAYFFQQ